MQKYSTKQREILLELLSDNADRPISVSDIVERLKGENISISAIYRNLAALEEEGSVQRLTIGGSKKVFYRFTASKKCKKHLHLSCHKCGKTYHMDVPATNSLIDEVLSGSDFKVDSVNTVLYGVCSKCRKGC